MKIAKKCCGHTRAQTPTFGGNSFVFWRFQGNNWHNIIDHKKDNRFLQLLFCPRDQIHCRQKQKRPQKWWRGSKWCAKRKNLRKFIKLGAFSRFFQFFRFFPTLKCQIFGSGFFRIFWKFHDFLQFFRFFSDFFNFCQFFPLLKSGILGFPIFEFFMNFWNFLSFLSILSGILFSFWVGKWENANRMPPTRWISLPNQCNWAHDHYFVLLHC